MRLEGSIDAFSLPDIFSLLSMTKKTGALHLRRASGEGVVWFTTGAISGGSSNTDREALARRLIGAGLVDDDALQAAIDAATADAVGVARALQVAGAVDESALHDLAEEHVVDVVFDLLRWPDGDFEFVVDEANPDDVGISRSVDDVIAEGRRRLDVWNGVAAAVPSPQTVLSLAIVPADDPQLSRDEWALLGLVDGRRTVGEIVDLCGRGDFAVVSALADLVSRGLLHTDGNDAASRLVRQHQLLARAERGPAPVEPAAAVDSAVVEESLVDVADETDDVDDVDDVEQVEEVAAAVTAIPTQPRHAPTPVPVRPEAVLPPRRAEHPDQPMPAAVGGGAVPAAAPAGLIERDPAVNKSLLLRLIAGVRGL